MELNLFPSVATMKSFIKGTQLNKNKTQINYFSESEYNVRLNDVWQLIVKCVCGGPANYL